MAKVKLNKADLSGLLKDEEVREQIKALVIELFGKDKWEALLLLLDGLLGPAEEESEDTEPEAEEVKVPWYKKLLKWAVTIVPILFKLFGKKR